MKKILFIALAIVVSSNCLAQTILWDGESSELGSKGGCWDDGTPSVVSNTENTGINTSAKCLTFTMTSSNKVVKIPFRDWTKPSMNGSKRVSLMIKKPVNSNVQIELSDPTNNSTSYWQKVAAWYGGSGAWQKVVFDFSMNDAFDCPGVISITAQTDDVSGEQAVYIDNVVIEDAPKVNGTLLSTIGDASLSGDIILTGGWMKGDCQNTNGTWQTVNYNDFSILATKLTAAVTSVDMSGAVVKDAYNAFTDVNPNIIVYATACDGDNVVINNAAAKLNFSEGYAFKAKQAFTASTVNITRTLASDYWNTFCVPFALTANSLGEGTEMMVYDETNTSGSIFAFKSAASIDAGVPCVVKPTSQVVNPTFSNVSITTAEAESVGNSNIMFTGVYGPTDITTAAEGFTNMFLAANNELKKVVAGSDKLPGMRCYFKVNSSIANGAKVQMGNATGIISVNTSINDAKQVYNLNGQRVYGNSLKGIYIVDGKKYIAK